MLRPCRTCGTPTPYTYCAAHGGDGRHARNVRNRTNTRYWRDLLRPQVLERDGYQCQLRLKGCTHVATTVHIDPRLGGNHSVATPADCLSACRHCHGVVDAPRSYENR